MQSQTRYFRDDILYGETVEMLGNGQTTMPEDGQINTLTGGKGKDTFYVCDTVTLSTGCFATIDQQHSASQLFGRSIAN